MSNRGPKDRYRNKWTDLRRAGAVAHGEAYDEGFQVHMAAARADADVWLRRAQELLDDPRMDAGARQFIERWCVALRTPRGFVTPGKARLLGLLERDRDISDRNGRPTFGGPPYFKEWMTADQTKAWGEAKQAAEQAAKRAREPAWMNDTSLLPKAPPTRRPENK